ncbi:MAG TPA: hypothetical protein PKK40_04595 [Marmoricola sp.]|nr:hypothetical protein [Marmoricola sp.]
MLRGVRRVAALGLDVPGDVLGTIASAVWSGRRYAEEFDAVLPSNDHVQFRREVTQLAPSW